MDYIQVCDSDTVLNPDATDYVPGIFSLSSLQKGTLSSHSFPCNIQHSYLLGSENCVTHDGLFGYYIVWMLYSDTHTLVG